MRPISVRFQCFGPYMAEQFINFEALEQNGLFLICGETGSGKTTILDAICYALYGKSSGGLRGGLEVMRCALAGSEDDTLVEFVFESNGKRYKFTRSLKYKTEKNKKSKNLNDYHNCLLLEGDSEIPMVEKEQEKYVTRKAEELIGLTYEQFRQVIILPQGQFERLLVSDSEEKETILVSLFHAQRWHKIAEELQRRVAERDKALKEERRGMEEMLRRYDCRDPEALEEKLSEQTRKLEELLGLTQQAETALEQARQDKECALLENQAFLELSNRERRLAALEKQEKAFDGEEMLLRDADKAEALHPQYLAYRTACSQECRAEQNCAGAQKALEEKQRLLAQVQQKLSLHDQQRPGIEESRKQILQLKNAREAYGVLAARQKEAAVAQAEEKQAGQAVQRSEKEFSGADSALKRAMDAQNQAMQAYQKIQNQYLLGIGATLARELKTGEPCPVCGSREHPAPAKAGQTHVTEEMLDDALKTMNKAGEKVSQTLNLRTSAEREYQEAERLFAEARRRADVAATAFREAQSQRLEGIETEQQRLQVLKTLELRLQQYEQTEQQLQSSLTAALGSREAAGALLEAAEGELASARESREQQQLVWLSSLEASGLQSQERYLAADLAAEEKQRRKTALHRFRAELEAARQALSEQRCALEGKTPPELQAAEKTLLDAERQHRSCVTAQTLAAKQLEDMTRDSAQLRLRLADYDVQRRKTDSDLIFARRLRGDNGISLQRYVLGVMLTSVTAEANRLLSGVYSGRYRLFRTDEISGRSRKSGLELEVYDSQTNQRRSVTTLSGGEKFLVALSLAIGLSTVVQAQGGGVRLEAMFVDEGFGSLDREAVGDALEVLQGIRRGCGIVGIISHVEQLAEVIPTRLEITKGRQGSVCTLRG